MVETLPKKKKIGFVASGGAAKAACFHMGVALALQRKGFSFRSGLARETAPPTLAGNEIEVLVGSSAGAFACSLILSGYPLEDVYRSFLGQRNPSFPMLSYGQMLDLNLRDTLLRFLPRLPKSLAIRGSGSLESLVQSLFCANGMCTTNKIERYLRKQLMPSNRFADLASEFFVVTTTLDNPGRLICGPRQLIPANRPQHYYDAETRYVTEIDISHAAAASMSLPPVFKPYPLRTGEGLVWVFDGEIRKTLSTHIAKDAGCDLIFVSYTHQPYHYREDIGSLIDYGIPSILVQTIYQLVESRILNSRETHEMKQMVLEEVKSFGRRHQINDSALNELMQILMTKLNFNPDVEYVFIHPSAREEDLFFSDHFNLSPTAMEKIAESGFRSAIRVLKEYNFTFSGETLAEKAG
ncbi:MAG: patatin-like phospholipase family protein [Candidatus Sericytochromatia bacterium]